MKTSSLALILTLTGALTTLADSPLINNISVRQRWPWSKKVDISFVVGATNVLQDAIFTAYNGAAKLGVIPDAALVGDHYGLPTAGGKCSVVFDPVKSGFSTDVIKDFRVEVATAESTTATNVLYKIINLSDSSSYPVTDVTEADLINNKYGSWQRNPVNGINSIIWTAVTNADVWATTKLVLRHIPAGSFYMGYDATNNAPSPSASQYVTLTNDFYIGVFEVTQRQWELIYSGNPRPSYLTNTLYYATRPVEQVFYATIRDADLANYCWPAYTAIPDTTFCGVLKARTGGLAFDIPTEAQWEYACRAGTQTQLYTGANQSSNGLGEICCWNRSTQADAAADLTTGSMRVGSYRPNAWGLYDMIGNVLEYCRDYYGTTLPASIHSPATTEPTGPAAPSTDDSRVVRGGCYCYGTFVPAGVAILVDSGRSYTVKGRTNRYFGFRIMYQP